MIARPVDPHPIAPATGAAAFDAAIVLGASARPDGSPSPAMERRVRAGIDLLRQGRAGCLLMSGGAVRHPTPEAWIMRELALAAGVAPEAVQVEDRARNTIENALYSAAIAARCGWGRIALVTDAYHLPRALYVFRRHGLKPAGAVAALPERRGKEWWLAYLREASALPWTVLRVERRIFLKG